MTEPALLAALALPAGLVVMLLIAAESSQRSVDRAAARLKSFAEGGPAPELPPTHAGATSRLIGEVFTIAANLASLRQRLEGGHPITGLPGREAFLDTLGQCISRSDRGALGVLRLADYDSMAAFDQSGADTALRNIALRLQRALGANRPLAQIDRDTFAVWFGEEAGPGGAVDEIGAVAYVLRQQLASGARSITPDIRVGAAVSPDDGVEPQTLLARAGAALSSSTQTSGGKVTLVSRNSSAVRERFSFEQDLRHAVAREQFELHFQPVVDLSAGRVVGAEALLRWRHAELGLIAPSKFIAIAEDAGMMNEIGLWVLNAACREANVWRESGLSDLKLAVNLSGRQLEDPALHSVILRTLERHGLSAQSLELELTETAAMEDSSRTRELFEQLRALGVGVAIDDFGSGYSSLSYLKNLPFSKLKIDREFVTSVHERRDSRAICSALVELCRGLDITVLAEGVEHRGEVEALRDLGCSMFQGFFFSRPVAAADFVGTVSAGEGLAFSGIPFATPRRGLLKARA